MFRNSSTSFSIVWIINIIMILISIFAVVAWIMNLTQLINCDWKESWKGEIIHAIGLIPYASIVTVFYPDK